jgi:AcrR family transcriptional regulator
MVSRATAYRYFPDIDALLAEASLDVDAPGADSLFPPGASTDPVARLEIVDKALHDLVVSREPQMRIMLAQTVVRALEPVAAEAIPARQNRRTPLIEAALAPAREEFSPAALRRLGHALALVIGTEGFIAAKDVLRLDDAETRRVKRWAIRALVEAARKPAHRG